MTKFVKDKPVDFFNWRFSRYVVLSLLKYGDIRHAYELWELGKVWNL